MVVEMGAMLSFLMRAAGVAGIFFVVNTFLPRRTAGVFAAYDFVVLWLFGGLAAAPLVNSKVSFTNALIAMLTVLVCHYGLSKLAVLGTRVSRFINGKPLTLVKNGQVLRKNMSRGLIPAWMLLAELRCVGLSDLSQVQYAILEPCGRISIIPKSNFWPVTLGDLGGEMSAESCLPTLLIEDGQILYENLARLNYDEGWLLQELNKQGIAKLADVYIASIDSRGNLYFSLKK